MIKKMVILLGILILLIPITVNAETFEDGATKYTLEEVVLDHDELKTNAYFMGLDENNNYVYEVIGDLHEVKYYKANKDKCELMTMQETLDFFKIYNSYIDIEINNYDLYLVEEMFARTGYVKATTFDSAQEYYVWSEAKNTFVEVDIPSEADVGNYYVKVCVTMPSSATIDNDTSYYIVEIGNLLTKVDNPVPEDILDYSVIVDEDEVIKKTKIKKLDSDVFGDILAQGEVFLASYNEDTKEIFLALYNNNDRQYYIYDLDGNLLEDVQYIEVFSNSLYAVLYSDGTFKILNKDFEPLYENKDESFTEMGYSNYIGYLQTVVDPSVEFYDEEFYNLYTYKLLSKDNQVYTNKDIKIEFSGSRDRIKTITVDGKVLSEVNYGLSGELTTITLKNAYLNTLAKGDYVLEVEYIDGVKLTTTFIKKVNPVLDDTPQTGSAYTSVLTLVGITTAALVGLTGTIVCSRKED